MWFYQLELHRRARFLRAKGLQVKIRGCLLVIEGGRARLTPPASLPLRLRRVMKRRALESRLENTQPMVISFPRRLPSSTEASP